MIFYQVKTNLYDITCESTIAQTGTYMHKTAQVIAKYLKLLYEKNDFIIKSTQDFAQLIRE